MISISIKIGSCKYDVLIINTVNLSFFFLFNEGETTYGKNSD